MGCYLDASFGGAGVGCYLDVPFSGGCVGCYVEVLSGAGVGCYLGSLFSGARSPSPSLPDPCSQKCPQGTRNPCS